jgi:hypothetical protein
MTSHASGGPIDSTRMIGLMQHLRLNLKSVC